MVKPGMKVQISDREGVFTVGVLVLHDDDPMLCHYQAIDETGNVQVLEPVSNFLPVVGDSCPACKQMFSIRFNPYANRMMPLPIA